VSAAFPALEHPIVQAPLAGGPSTPELAAAVSNAGGLGFVAAGYLKPEALAEHIDRTRQLTDRAFAVNLFYLSESTVDEESVRAYVRSLNAEADSLGASLGEPRFEDDFLEAKLELVIEKRIPIVSFTFGCPSEAVVKRLHEHDAAVWVTVTDVEEARAATEAGADALTAQGVEAGGHRGSFTDADGTGEMSLIPLLRLIGRETDLPLVAAGGIADGHGVAAALAAGARAAQIGTALMRTPEAGTAQAHRDALSEPGATALTRAFTGRRARGIVNRFMREHEADAPHAYPHIHHVTSPLRRLARERGDAQSINLWAGEAHLLAQERPAAELVRTWAEEAREALADAQRLLG
jgi:nitronate monooxygenase